MLSGLRNILSDNKHRLRQSIYKLQLANKKVEVPTDDIALSYGPAIGSELEQRVSLTGGKVKLAHLHRRYRHSETKFNILYLVSSALPPYSVELAKWAREIGVKVVLNQNGVAYPAWTSNYDHINAELSALIKASNLVIYQTNYCKDTADRFLGLADGEWAICTNCVDIDTFFPIACKKTDVIRLLIAGTHYQRERVTLSLAALRFLLDRGFSATLMVAGQLAWEGADDDIKQLINQLQLADTVFLKGSYTQLEAPTIFSEADILLHFKYKDPCPNVVIEALASGLPVLGSASGGLPELVGENAGVLLEVPDQWDHMCYPAVDQIEQGLGLIVSRLSDFQGAARRHAVKHFDHESWLRFHEDWFQDLVLS